MRKNCECCNIELEIAFGQTKYCNNCSIYTKELNKEIGVLKRRLKEIELNKV